MHILDTTIQPLVKIKPVHGFILIQKLSDVDNIIQLPDGVNSPLQQWLVLDVSEQTTCVKPQDRILIIPDARIVKVDNEQAIGLMHDNAVVGIVP